MLKSCSYCGRIHPKDFECKKKTEARSRYCRDKKIKKFRDSGKWKNKREAIKSRDFYLCRLCFLDGVINSDNLQVHHIIPIAESYDNRLDDNNLITLCQRCHEKAENGEIDRNQLLQLATDIQFS